MLKFIWNSWWRNKERFILLLIGVLILSTGLSYLIGTTQASNGTVVDELQKRWESSYHLVVRPEGSRSVTEDLNLLEPNYLSGMDGGITLDQYETIKAMTDVEIAAPIAMMGSIRTDIQLDSLGITEPGIYRMNILEETDTGAKIETYGGNTYVTVGAWRPDGTEDFGASPMPSSLSYGTEVMIAGIDPAAESALVGIDQAMIDGENSRFFNAEDLAQKMDERPGTQIPVIVSNTDYVDATMTYSIEKLDIPFSAGEQMKVMEEIKQKGGETYLEKQEGTPVEEYVYTTADVHEKLIQGVLDPSKSTSGGSGDFTWMPFKPSPVDYQPVTSPFGNRWPYSYQVQPYAVPEDSLLAVRHMYRPVSMFGETSADWPTLQLDYIGVFDPQKLQMSKDPLTELPMETYFPAKAQWVVDAENNPVNPFTDMKPVNNPYGFLTKPPLILTTIEAAAQVLGEEPISAIRVNVAGVEELNEESEAKLQAVAKEIEKQTGLITDVTLGSSPQLALTHLPGLEGEEALGWVQQPWIKLGSSISIFQEAKIGMTGVIASVILVAVVYVFASNIIMLYARKKEFAVLLSLGWRPSQLSKLLLLESTLLGTLVALISWLILGTFLVSGSIDTSLIRVFLIGVSGLAIYWFGSLVPIWLIRRIKPYESMRSGEISHRVKRIVRSESVIGMSFNNLFSQWQRSLLSILAIAVPTSLFIFFLFITFRLKGVLYATWLGEFVALEVGTMHYVAMGVALLIAVLTTTEIMWQNVSERQAQIAVLKATGWQNAGVRFLVLWEGILIGLLAGIIGLGISLIIIYYMYGQVPVEEFGFLAMTLLIPVITGVLGATLPAQKAARILPYQAINGTLHNSKKVEKQFKWAIGSAGASLVAGILILFLYAIPDSSSEATGNVMEKSGEKTVGELTNGPKPSKESATSSEAEEENEVNATGDFAELKEDAWKVLSLGESTDDNPLVPILTFGNLAQAPADLIPENPENTFLSIPVSIKYNSDRWFIFKSQAFKLFDEDGEQYVPKHVEEVNVGNWKENSSDQVNISEEANGDFKVILIYEVPKDHGELALYLNTLEYADGPVVVDIPAAVVQTDSAESADAIAKLKEVAYRSYVIGDEVDIELKAGNLVESPPNIKPSSEQAQLISIPLTLDFPKDDETDGFSSTYKPQSFKVIDKPGNEYSVVDIEVAEKGPWVNNYKFVYPGRTSVILTYEIPKQLDKVALHVQSEVTDRKSVV